LLFTPLA
jgi:hypothetical protein